MLLAVGLIAWYVAGHWAQFGAVWKLDPCIIAAVLGLDALVFVYMAAAVAFSVRPFGVGLSLSDAWVLSGVTRFGNLVTPFRGGAMARAVYLKRVHNLSYPHFVAGLSGMLLANLGVSILFAMLGLIYVHGVLHQPVMPAILVLAVVLAVLLAGAALRPRMAQRGSPARVQLARLANGWSDMCRSRSAIFGMAASYACYLLTMAVIYWLLLGNMGHAIPWLMVLVIVSVGNVSTVFQITPSNIGVYEGLIAAIGAMVGVGVPEILAATLTWRVLDALLVLINGLVCSHIAASRSAPKRHCG
jgi:uncharacterized membrane protein YbhN (UPF0104 family)